MSLQLTPDNSNLRGKSKKVWVIESSSFASLKKMARSWTFLSHLLVEILTENWKILLDYKSELNVKKYSPNRAYVLLFWEVKDDCSHWICDKQHQSSLVNYMPSTRQWEIQNSMLRKSTFFSLTFEALKTWFQLLGVKLHWNDLRGNKNYFELAGGLNYWGFELLMIQLQ